jgi:hypothetical protein
VTFRVTTVPGGQNSGRDFIFRAHSAEAALEWVYVIRDLSKAATALKLRFALVLRARARLRIVCNRWRPLLNADGRLLPLEAPHKR